MPKRLISTNLRTEALIKGIGGDTTISAFINAAVLDEKLPVFSPLRTEALYLLDEVTDGAKDWTGNKLVFAGENSQQKSIEFAERQALSRAIQWLKQGHHIKCCSMLMDVVGSFAEGKNGIPFSTQNEHVQDQAQQTAEMIKSIDAEYNAYHICPGSDARDVLEHWVDVWDMNDAYNALIICVENERIQHPIPALSCISILQKMENQVIQEALDASCHYGRKEGQDNVTENHSNL